MKIQGTLRWASVQSPNTKYTPQWQVDVVLTPDQEKSIKKLGLKVKLREDEDGNAIKVVTFKRPVVQPKTGAENKPPVVVDANNEPFTDLIGNGSEGIVQFSVYEWNNAFGSGVGCDLQGVQVLEHVPAPSEASRVPDGAEFTPVDSNAADSDFDDDAPEGIL